MKRLYIIILLLILGSANVRARSPRIGFGIEWGLDSKLAETYSYNYISKDGYRVFREGGKMNYHLNADILAQASLYFGKYSCLGIYSGYCGISQDREMIPLSLRYSLYPKGHGNDGLMCFADAGTGFQTGKIRSSVQKPCATVKLGAGYHYVLSSFCNLEMMVSARGVFDSPPVKEDDGSYAADLRFSSACYFALCFSIALNF